MKAVIFRSLGEKRETDAEYLQEFDDLYAGRVISNITNEPGYCSPCLDDCNGCRSSYDNFPASDLLGVFNFPVLLPYLLERPEDYVPAEIPQHDVLLVINIHEQILLEILKVCKSWGTRGVVVPIEELQWISLSARTKALEYCEHNGIEISFPKPFCDFKPPEGSLLAEFRRHFHIGCPEVDIAVEDGTIVKADVKVSAACGATYNVARWLIGRSLKDDIEMEVVAKRMQSFPCTAGMKKDPELNNDTIMHVAGEAHLDILRHLKDVMSYSRESVFAGTPMEKVAMPIVPPKDNLKNINYAKQRILDDIAEKGSISIDHLRNMQDVSPAAASSAYLLLKQEGVVNTSESAIIRCQ